MPITNISILSPSYIFLVRRGGGTIDIHLSNLFLAKAAFAGVESLHINIVSVNSLW